MATLFLIIIYLAFISLGLPDSLLGVAWPLMQKDYGAPLDAAGWLFMIVAGGTIVSSLASGRLLNRFGTGKVTFVSCLMTAVALFGFSFSPSLLWLIICCIPLGLGAGSVDAGLNNYVAAHYKAHHMSWLHCFWGVGATMSPIIMSRFIDGNHSWRDGYLTVSIIQFALVVLLFLTLPLWDRIARNKPSKHTELVSEGESQLTELEETDTKPLRIKGVKLALLSFLFYCGVETTMGLWGASFLVNMKEISAATAASWVSLYYGGITAGRFITGFITFKISNKMLIRSGQFLALLGAILLCLPLPASISVAGFLMVGLGLAPIYPCMLHETPARFGHRHSQTIMGYQMAVAYTGSTFMPPILGFLATHTTIGIFPFYVSACAAAMLILSERLNIKLGLTVFRAARNRDTERTL
ncbi:MFS transporter [Paenibacillus sp. CAA11]|uniref:MFS transporter n=1 Tax=Paenibacillus sp. CAA11 TaxID=1532905 RepID=UPI000D35C540|nr:MFS transporter [Paenibacillus sp. CAA11]AWB45926.1 MFS transporter [Paenibacillus sp. CAA11]